ncbi:sulfite oxidase heme-binding subunit YedZ [Thaumasiovibrio sp. DFM-14]|uniref:sulfite oxidase heme-binding subunit YedZ n=1 Tax=Thaumasiovibrio sp. DFM-14 TaxID=3384792 RepID=UPI0039A045AE
MRILKALLHCINISFVAYMLTLAFSDKLGADPVQGLSHFTGKAAIHVLFLTLLISPLSQYFRISNLIPLRRPMGLYAFFWATLHISVYIGLDLNFQWRLLFSELTQRTYLIVGFIAFTLLISLAITSVKSIQVSMRQHWQTLHNTIYLIVLLVPVHYLMSTKSDWVTPSGYLVVSIALLTLRWNKIKRIVNRFSFRRYQHDKL